MNYGVIFDMDGVIVNSNPVHKEAIRIFCNQHKLEVEDSFLEKRVYGRTNKEWIPELFKDISEEDMLRLADEKEALFRRMFDPVKHEVPGFKTFLADLKSNNVKTVVATSAPGENAEYILSALDISDQFELVLDSSHVEKGKPEPEIYLKAAEGIGMAASECFVFEDSLAGAEAGKRAGALVIGLTTTHTDRELSECRITIPDFLAFSSNALEQAVKKN